MSSWYVFSALGMYPQVPSRAELTLSSPLFPRIEIERPGGADIEIRARARPRTPRTSSRCGSTAAAANGLGCPASFVRDGGTLDYTLSATPDRSWGSAEAAAPPSFRTGEQPYQIGVGPTAATLAPGGSTALDIRALALAAAPGPRSASTWTCPPGVTATPPRARSTDGAQRIALTAADDAEQGFYDVKVTVDLGRHVVRRSRWPSRSRPRHPSSRPTTTPASPTTAGDHDEADYDGGGWSYSRQALAAAGLTPGGQGTVDGLDLHLAELARPAAPTTPRPPARPSSWLSPPSRVVLHRQRRQRQPADHGDRHLHRRRHRLRRPVLHRLDRRRRGRHRPVRQRDRRQDRRTAMSPAPTRTRWPPTSSPPSPSRAPAGKTIKSVKLPDNADLHVFTLAVSRWSR